MQIRTCLFFIEEIQSVDELIAKYQKTQRGMKKGSSATAKEGSKSALKVQTAKPKTPMYSVSDIAVK